MTKVLHACAVGSYKWCRICSYVKLTSLSIGKNDKQIDRYRQMQYTVIITRKFRISAHVFRKYVLNHNNCNGIIWNIFCMSPNRYGYRLYFAQTVTLKTNAKVNRVRFNFSIDINRENALNLLLKATICQIDTQLLSDR